MRLLDLQLPAVSIGILSILNILKVRIIRIGMVHSQNGPHNFCEKYSLSIHPWSIGFWVRFPSGMKPVIVRSHFPSDPKCQKSHTVISVFSNQITMEIGSGSLPNIREQSTLHYFISRKQLGRNLTSISTCCTNILSILTLLSVFSTRAGWIGTSPPSSAHTRFDFWSLALTFSIRHQICMTENTFYLVSPVRLTQTRRGSGDDLLGSFIGRWQSHLFDTRFTTDWHTVFICRMASGK